jgi:hypothetical protein
VEQGYRLQHGHDDALPASDQPSRGLAQHETGDLDFRHQRRDASLARGMLGATKRIARRLHLQPPDCNPCNDQFARRRQQRRQRPRVDLAKDTLGLFEGADQQRTPSLNIACMSRIQAIPVRFERRPRFVEGLRRPAEIARYEREFGLGDDAPRTRHRLSRTEHARGFLERGFSRTRSSSCAIAMPRSARAGGSSRNPTRFKAPNASPDAKASAAAVINASIAAP